mgnify:CR=1 FL=1
MKKYSPITPASIGGTKPDGTWQWAQPIGPPGPLFRIHTFTEVRRQIRIPGSAPRGAIPGAIPGAKVDATGEPVTVRRTGRCQWHWMADTLRETTRKLKLFAQMNKVLSEELAKVARADDDDWFND